MCACLNATKAFIPTLQPLSIYVNNVNHLAKLVRLQALYAPPAIQPLSCKMETALLSARAK